ncbi:hypothetical protein [Thermaerobacter subterraneus]|uniref:Uncharacterized protein n=1 Tax=Thermaerobacter subterraneus DSM 13965 TaxID=867903 RepID=K6QES8_9FIRM|nr:hypothetical protein [Thermaerobacter subterraneus]EKP95396.1 hypothetical protein ThesuDRAFT_01148 [Thermaerobacter subterraneus DSM 13965]
MVVLLLAGLAGVLGVVGIRRSLVDRVQGHGLTRHLLRLPWFHRDTGAGGFLLASNLLLFGAALALLAGVVRLQVPYLHWLVMAGAVVASVYLWLCTAAACRVRGRHSVRVALLGSSPYLFLAAAFSYRLAGLQPAYPGDDLVMAAVGLIAAVLVTAVAFATCLLIVGFSGRRTRAA